MDDASKIIQTLSTHKGTFTMNRLSFWIKSAPSQFYKILDSILHGLNGVVTYFDDIVVHGATITECQQSLFEALRRL